MTNTEPERRKAVYGPADRLALALVDILTGVTEASLTLEEPYGDYKSWVFKVKKSGIQDD